MFDVFSVKRMYNIKVSTGKNTWFLVKIDDDDDDDDGDLMEIGTSGQLKGVKRSALRSVGQRSRSHEGEVR